MGFSIVEWWTVRPEFWLSAYFCAGFAHTKILLVIPDHEFLLTEVSQFRVLDWLILRSTGI